MGKKSCDKSKPIDKDIYKSMYLQSKKPHIKPKVCATSKLQKQTNKQKVLIIHCVYGSVSVYSV